MDAPSAGYAFEYLIETLNDSSHKKFFNVPRLGGTKYAGKEFTCNVGDLGLIPGLGRFPGEGKRYPLQYSGLENSMDYSPCPTQKESDMAE